MVGYVMLSKIWLRERQFDPIYVLFYSALTTILRNIYELKIALVLKFDKIK